MALDLSSITAEAVSDAAMPKTARGRTAEPIPDDILTIVKDSYNLPDGRARQINVPNGAKIIRDGKETDDFENPTELVNVLRRAARQLNLGLSVKIVPVGKAGKQSGVLFRAKDFTPRPRRPADGEAAQPDAGSNDAAQGTLEGK